LTRRDLQNHWVDGLEDPLLGRFYQFREKVQENNQEDALQTSEQVLGQEIQSWSKFRRALRREDQEIFDHFSEKDRLHFEAGVNASRPCPLAIILISVLLEQEKALVELREKVEDREK